MSTQPQRLSSDAGSSAVELCIFAASIFALIAIIALGGRIMIVGDAVQSAAAEAARAASISRTEGEAQTAAAGGAAAIFANSDLTCAATSVRVDTAGFSAPVGTAATVTATVECEIALDDLMLLPGLPGSHRISSTMTSPLDTYRGRS
jgi:Flp pilus assembly protein TadG